MKKITEGLEVTIREKMVNRVNDFLFVLHKKLGTVEEIYVYGKIGLLLKERKTTLGAFRRTISRMREGIGLLNDPVLLTVILEETGYSAQALFCDETTSNVNSKHFFGSDDVTSLEKIIFNAVQEAQKPVTRIAKIEKRLNAAKKISETIQMLILFDDFSMAFFMLFINYSRVNPQLYRHSEGDRQLLHIDRLIGFITNNYFNKTQEIKNIFGKLLSLCYIIFEIRRICKAFISYSIKRESKTLSSKSKYEGFIFPQNYSRKDLEKDINLINDNLETVVDASINTSNIIFCDGNNSILYSNQLLYKLLQKNIDIPDYSKLLSQETIINKVLFTPDFSLTKNFFQKPRYICEIDNDFISIIDKIKVNISALANENITHNTSYSENQKKSIFAMSNDDIMSDEIDDTTDNDIEETNDVQSETIIDDEEIEVEVSSFADEIDDTVDDN
jgi:hypothetical protein